MFRHPLPEQAELEGYYADPAYLESAYFADSGQGPAAAGPEVGIYLESLAWLDGNLVSVSAGERKLLDVGCGNGQFLALAEQHRWKCEGIELSHELCERARSLCVAELHRGDFLDVDLPAASYDVVTMWDLLEHVLDPDLVLARARELLRPGGCLVVFTINSESLFNWLGDISYRATGGRLTTAVELLYDARHNWYLTPSTLDRLLKQAGLRAVDRCQHRAYLGRWLSEPAPVWVKVAGNLVDLASMAASQCYRQLVYCRAV